jgi:hypothetical protein
MPTVLRFKRERNPQTGRIWAAWEEHGGGYGGGSSMGFGLTTTLLKMSPTFGIQRMYFRNQAWQVVRIGDEWMATEITNEEEL